MYSAQLLDHFEHPRNAGAIAGADADVRLENPACGDVLRLTLKLSDGRIAEVGFQAKGCVASMACASALTELVCGRTIEEARRLSQEQLANSVGGLPPTSSHAGLLALDALKTALDRVAGKA